MRRTAAHILSSPNPAQLEMRILANHGSDQRFAFLRGRWSRAWRTTKSHNKVTLHAEKLNAGAKSKDSEAALGGLLGYGDSDESQQSDSDVGSERKGASLPMIVGLQGATSSNTIDNPSDDEIKRARRAKAREWSKRRKMQQSPGT